MIRTVSTEIASSKLSVTALGDHQHDSVLSLPKSLPALFSMLDAILNQHVERVSEDLRGFLEANPVLALVCPVLRFVPLELDVRHNSL